MELAGYVDVERRLPVKDRQLLDTAFKFQAQMRDAVRTQAMSQSTEALSQVVAQGHGDRTYKIDKAAERFLEGFGVALSKTASVELVAEGVGQRKYPQIPGTPELKVIADLVDGTRGIMYDMYSAWTLAGIAPNKGEETTLEDVNLAVMTEIPVVKQGKGSVVWAAKGMGAYEEVWDFKENRIVSVRKLTPSTAQNLEHGFAVFADPFSVSGKRTNALRDKVVKRVLGERSKSLVFNDQILCSGGQLYRLATGKYRFFADLMPIEDAEQCTHPYDLATILVAKEAGVIITDMQGNERLPYPLDTHTNCGFIGYANEAIRQQVEPVLLEELSKLT